jgi:hypothetical protein
MVDLQRVPPKEPKDMSHLRKGSETTLGWGQLTGRLPMARITMAVSRQPQAGNREPLKSLEHCRRGGVETQQRPLILQRSAPCLQKTKT